MTRILIIPVARPGILQSAPACKALRAASSTPRRRPHTPRHEATPDPHAPPAAA